ncbi:MAG: hypothetical protein F6J93_28545 [Oscillatoria sp. SIO1A7]|nr:hypothetical protein [Oscillatoria sp. SIO1A7]
MKFPYTRAPHTPHPTPHTLGVGATASRATISAPRTTNPVLGCFAPDNLTSI